MLLVYPTSSFCVYVCTRAHVCMHVYLHSCLDALVEVRGYFMGFGNQTQVVRAQKETFTCRAITTAWEAVFYIDHKTGIFFFSQWEKTWVKMVLLFL